MTKQESSARVHRFRDSVCLDTESTDTVYLSPTLARQLGEELLRFAADCEAVTFTKSTLRTINLDAIPDRYRIEEAVGGGFIALCAGFQIGGNVDASGAGDAVFPTRPEAVVHILAADARYQENVREATE